MDQLLLVILIIIFLLAGVVSTVLLIFPSLAFMFIVSFIYALIDHFQHLSALELGILAAIAASGEVLDYILGFLGAKISGARFKSLLWGALGMIVGLILYPPFGGLAGLFLGIVISEIIIFKKGFKSLKAGFGGVLGSIAGLIIKIILAVVFLVLFLIFVL
ncbi:MAG: DUF456 domain-containing protein [Patescibacteria group bacterium]